MLFADDAKIYHTFDRNESVVAFSKSLSNFCFWAKTWQLNIAMKKCSVLPIGFKNPCANFFLNEVEISHAASVRDLGITVTKDLKFSAHCSDIAAKALGRVALLFRAFQSFDMSVLLRAYITYVRPVVEFETYVWSPHYAKDIDCIERVQHVFTRRLYERCSLPHVEYKIRLKELNLESLELRRLKNDLIMCYKILYRLVDVDRDKFFTVIDDNRMRNNGFKLKLSKFSLDVSKFFFASRVIKPWNNLPRNVVLSKSVDVFRKTLTDYLNT